jgi:flavin-dependent dehydrogenase
MDENGALVRSGTETYRIKARIIIGADGPHTKVGRLINSPNMDLIPAIQVVANLAENMDLTEVYFDKDLYGGYGWLFPKGCKANIGIAMRSFLGSLSKRWQKWVSRDCVFRRVMAE